MRLLNRIPIRIHSWGGLGSQLFAWALHEDLAKRFPSRQIIFIHHESGVTLRESELSVFFPGKVISVHDWNPIVFSDTPVTKKIDVRSMIFTFGKKILGFLGLVVEANTDTDFLRIRPWLLSTRGHYSYRTITSQVIQSMMEKSMAFANPIISDSDETINKLALHYRLGDLLVLHEKSPMDPARLKSLLQLDANLLIGKIELFSDSPSVALDILTKLTIDYEISTTNSQPIETLKTLTTFSRFIGTNSKISIWAALFLVWKSPTAYIWLPYELNLQIQYNLELDQSNNRICFY